MSNTQINEVIMDLITTIGGKVPVNAHQDTILMKFICQKMEAPALALIATGKSQPEIQNKGGNTSLIMACMYKQEKVALALIATGKSQPEIQNQDGYTALMCACYFKMENVALALIATGKSQPEIQNQDGYTALIRACQYKLEKVALALIATGKSQPEIQDKFGCTALNLACFYKMEKVALALIATGHSNYLAKDNNKNDALFYANREGLTQVCQKIEELENPAPTPVETLKCMYCEKTLEKKTHILVSCGHTNFHTDCVLKNLLENSEKKCPTCQQEITAVIKLQ